VSVMMFWILIAVLTAAAALSVLVPLTRNSATRGDARAGHAADAAVYRQQLAEVEKDQERGLIEPQAAEAARVEIARRLLAADELSKGEAGAGSQTSRLPQQLVMVMALIVLPLGAFGLYLVLGSPDLSDQPLQARLDAPAENQSVEMLVARVERHLAENPQDGQGWSVVAPVYMRIGNPAAAANAYANAIRLLGSNPKLETDLGEALTVANNGIVSADAQAAFERAVELDAAAVKPRFFLALALGQEGKTEEAIASWNDLLDGADPNEPWVPAAQAQLAQLGGAGAGPAAGSGQGGGMRLPGPGKADIAAAQDMSAQDRTAMIAGMVQGLAERLKSDGGSVDEWLRLIRAYSVMGERDKASEAVKMARAAYADDAGALGQINEMAKTAGVESP
jgi:cytochrome c-type biogenesis protein CcmH